MPRPKKEAEAGAEPKKRSRTGCWPCKAKKIKCGEEKAACTNCVKAGEPCDYSIRLNWGGRSRRDKDGTPADADGFTFVATPSSVAPPAHKGNGHGPGHEHVFSSQHIATAPARLSGGHPHGLPTPESQPSSEIPLDPRLQAAFQAASQLHLPEPKPFNYVPYAVGLTTSRPSPGLTDYTSPTSMPAGEDFRWSPQHKAKRVKLDRRGGPYAPTFAIPQYPPHNEPSPALTHLTPHSISSIVNTPATPGSIIGSPYQPHAAGLGVQDAPDLRRLSVKSLLSDPEEGIQPLFQREVHGYTTYGYDHGLPDLDIPHNDDAGVVLPRSPDMRRPSRAVSDNSITSNEGDGAQIAFEPGGYYAQPVPVRVARALEPLPKELRDNPMNLLYFHHFINHTGRIMVTHDCPDNPFRGVLPQMAVRNTHLLHLVLAYSASHRAKLLDHPEPATRIAGWMSDVLPALREALDEQPSSPASNITDPTDPSSLAPLATAIMLASWEIMLPNRLGVRITWQAHLQIARQLIVAKGGLDHLAQKADGARDKAVFFLSRWFAYLDVLGSLSSRHEQPLFGAYLENGGGLWLVNRDDEEVHQIDCFFGFSGRCIALLAQVAELAAQCDNQRIDPVTNQVKAGWQPGAYVRQQAKDLQKRLLASAGAVARSCVHTDANHPRASAVSQSPASFATGSTPSNASRTATTHAAIHATNRAYHHAGLIHLSRRALALPPPHAAVQASVQAILACLQEIPAGSSAESCLLFPMFTAGCEALDERDREVFMGRLREVEGWGMQHVGRAREIMREVWDSGRGWEVLCRGEFFG